MRQVGRYGILLGQTIRSLFTRPVSWYDVFAQMHNAGNRSLLFITFVMAFLGLIGIYETCMQMLKLIPDLSVVGPASIPVIIRELGPVVVALMLSTRIGAGIAAEIGSMKVTDQLDAMRLSGTDPVEYLMVPRVTGVFVMSMVLMVWGIGVTIVSGMLIADARFGVNPRTFFDLGLTSPSDVVIAITKAAAFGLAIPVISAESGFSATGGSEGVGWATTRAVVNSSFACIVLDFVISTVGYMVT